jgi:hypothetical protein
MCIAIHRSLPPVIARNEAIQAQATTWIASFLAMTGEIGLAYENTGCEIRHFQLILPFW